MFKNTIMEKSQQSLEEKDLLLKILNESSIVGVSFDVNYEDISILTNDFWKMEANGIPHNSFLIASPFNKSEYTKVNEIDKECILLRVVGECSIPNEDIWREAKIDKIKSLKDMDLDSPANKSLTYDNYSKNEMSFSGLKCRVLGTFFVENDILNFGADLENYYGTRSLYIYKPTGSSLETILNFVDPMRQKDILKELKKMNVDINDYNELDLYSIGNVRYTSTNRMQRKDKPVNVYVNPFDFIARRTATFGMTRTGKSNTVKTLIKTIDSTAIKHSLKISQIVFDNNGEYAFPNVQDGNSSIGTEIPNSVVYTLNSKVKSTDSIKQLKFNFYENLTMSHEFITSLLSSSGIGTSATDIQAFCNMDLMSSDDNDLDYREKTKIQRIENLYKYLLYLLGCKTNNEYINLLVSKSNVDQAKKKINGKIAEIESKESYGEKISASDKKDLEYYNKLLENILAIHKHLSNGKSFNLGNEEEASLYGDLLKHIHEINRVVKLKTSSGGDLIKDDIETLLNICTRTNANGGPFLGYITIKKVNANSYHDFESNDYIRTILEEMIQGRTIILDISNATKDMRDRVTKKIVEKIFNHNLNIFTEGRIPPKVILYVEEAHNLIGKDMELTDVWPRTAKEGAKYGIGMVYSTQEPSSINKNILSNTENWFITHLNNEDEIKVLSKFYDFGDFKDSLSKAKDVGFARIKTMSQNFVLPVQIKKYEGGE
ncbi:TPA: DUF87 domain-containing protein [Clostridioides difficile]|uniref:ATP-binding protein n=2 Tax=Clostridioides difficile TaxID=1496 RepID=UPI00093CC159|nr:DUF87 domain-containing protein [Clostridioides difficile]EGT2198321.1 DUF87 domain-containing protein [Clostridioides difficile]EGT4046753.1 DUF87 domain-containing protein [Clostridioides difficile]EGT4942378.1 DUF87 domain-containing protein [Clostridioides difficile]MCU5873520.1 ATP-binding protein [Clostridioides difficile]MCU5897805.1 ATP-binding protein [Clostridioides difficile]